MRKRHGEAEQRRRQRDEADIKGGLGGDMILVS